MIRYSKSESTRILKHQNLSKISVKNRTFLKYSRELVKSEVRERQQQVTWRLIARSRSEVGSWQSTGDLIDMANMPAAQIMITLSSQLLSFDNFSPRYTLRQISHNKITKSKYLFTWLFKCNTKNQNKILQFLATIFYHKY